MTNYQPTAPTTQPVAFGLWNPENRTGYDIIDVSYVPIDAGTVWVITRQADFDNPTRMDISKARGDYKARLDRGYKKSHPIYTRVEIDKFSRISCLH